MFLDWIVVLQGKKEQKNILKNIGIKQLLEMSLNQLNII